MQSQGQASHNSRNRGSQTWQGDACTYAAHLDKEAGGAEAAGERCNFKVCIRRWDSGDVVGLIRVRHGMLEAPDGVRKGVKRAVVQIAAVCQAQVAAQTPKQSLASSHTPRSLLYHQRVLLVHQRTLHRCDSEAICGRQQRLRDGADGLKEVQQVHGSQRPAAAEVESLNRQPTLAAAA